MGQTFDLPAQIGDWRHKRHARLDNCLQLSNRAPVIELAGKLPKLLA